MSKLFATFQERFGDWLTALGQHLQLSLLTLLLAIFLAVPLAIYLSTRKRASNWVFTGSWDLPDYSFHGPSRPLHYPSWESERFRP